MIDARSGFRALTPPTPVPRRRTPVLSLVGAALLSFGVALGPTGALSSIGPAPAGADDVSNLQAQAVELSRQLLLEQLQVGGYRQQYQAATERAQADEAALAETEARIGEIQGHLATETADLRQEAINAYVQNGTGGDAVSALFTNDADQAVRAVYQNVVAGSLADTLDQLRSDRGVLSAEQAARERIVGQDQADQAQAAGMLQRSESTQAELGRQNAEVTGQLAVAVATQHQQQSLAAQAAVRAADAQAAARPAPGSAASTETVVSGSAGAGSSGPGPGVPVPTGSSTDPALPPFLQCVIHYESGGDYQAVSPDGLYMGAFQFSQPTWNVAAQLAGRPDLIGVPPNLASRADQDTLAVALYNADGSQPWYDPCSNG